MFKTKYFKTFIFSLSLVLIPGFFAIAATNVSAAQSDTYTFPVYADVTSTNDPGYASSVTDIDRQWGLLKTYFDQAWDKSKGSSSIVVAIIDTGIDGTHEDLSAGQVGAGFNFLTKTTIDAGVNSDDNGHGTLVAGVIGATTNNFRGIAGGAMKVTLMPLKALDAAGSGNSGDIAAAIIWAADHGANIINMSLGGIGFANDTTLSGAITYAYNKNVLLVAAAGNDVASTGGNLDTSPVYPICDDNGQNMVLGVAATDSNDQKALFSNYGKSCVDVTAPGKRILSTISFDPKTHAAAPNGYAYASGTSLAAPLVTAEAVLLKAYFTDASNKEIRNRIIASADPIDSINLSQCNNLPCAGLIGTGRINVLKAFDSNLISSKIFEGDLVIEKETTQLYYISGGQKQPVSFLVRGQRFIDVTPIPVSTIDLITFPTGPYAIPMEGTIVKTPIDNTVYEIFGGNKRPLTKQIFDQRSIGVQQIMVVGDLELNSWITGKFMPPVEGTLIKTTKNPTVYWVVDGLLHPINYTFWTDRGLNIFPILKISSEDLKGFAQGNPYIR